MLNFTLNKNQFVDLEYIECVGYTDENTPILSEEVTKIKGLRLKGRIRYTPEADGDKTTSDIKFNTEKEVKIHSMLEGREVMDCQKLTMSIGYIVYVK